MSSNACKKMKQSIEEAENAYEVGGCLLGMQCAQIYLIIDLTVPSMRSTQASESSFILDGVAESEKVKMLMKKYRLPLHFLGVWHSHTAENDWFSEQDIQSNWTLADIMGETLSILAICKDSSVRLNGCCIKSSVENNAKIISFAGGIQNVIRENFIRDRKTRCSHLWK